MKIPDSELRRLTDDWHDGRITPEDALRLERRLLEDPEARRYYFEVSEIESELPRSAERPHAKPLSEKRKNSGWRKIAAVFVAGIFTGGLGWQLWRTETSVASAPPPVEAARITGMLGISWKDATGLQSLSSGTDTRIGSGLIELTFASGARAVLEGPASFHVTGGNSMRLEFGKLVADVPKGAEGFTVAYADGEIVDIGTEFGVEVSHDGKSANLGVFRGEIEYRPQGDPGRMIRLLENHAVIAEAGNITSVPFLREKFTRKFPSREFAWEIAGPSGQLQILQYDVSHLIWKPDRYRIICKWMRGPHGIVTESAELLLDGERVDEDSHEGFTGLANLTRANTYELSVPPDAYRRGVWTLRLGVRADTDVPVPSVDSSGVILVEQGLALDATASDFIGTWEYLHDGKIFRRTFSPDGTAHITINGNDYTLEGSRWRVENGLLLLKIPDLSSSEEHLLRDADTLIFSNLPYRDAKKIPDEAEE